MTEPPFPLGDDLRAARRAHDLSQRGLAAVAGVSRSLVGVLEADPPRDARLRTVTKLFHAAGCRLLVADAAEGPLVISTRAAGVRDEAGRHYPARLDVRDGHDLSDWWFGPYLTTLRPLPRYSFDLSRGMRDRKREQRRREDPGGGPSPSRHPGATMPG